MWAFLLLKIKYLLNYEIIENEILTFFRMCYKLLVVKDIIAFHIIFHIFTNIDISHRQMSCGFLLLRKYLLQ